MICFGPRSGKSATFVLLSEWLPNEQPIRREEALAKLADRYFASHGPATMQDFMWWSGLTAKDARQAIQAAELSRQTLTGAEYWSPTRQCHELGVVSPMAHLLPAFDEYLLGYRNRDAVVEPKHATKIAPGGGVFRPILVMNGRVAGTWTRTVKAAGIIVDVTVFQKLTKQAEDAVAAAASRYSRFLEKPVKLHFLPRR